MEGPPNWYPYSNPAQGQGYYQGPPVQAPPQSYAAPPPGYYQGPPVQAPPQSYAASPPRKEPGFLGKCLEVLCCCFDIVECCYYCC